MRVWDLHCDTLSALRHTQQAGGGDVAARFAKIATAEGMVDMAGLQAGDYLLQCFACFVNLGEGGSPLQTAMEQVDIFYRLLDAYPALTQVCTPQDVAALPGSGKIGAMLTVEEGGCCLDSLGVLRDLYRLGVRMMTLTWNHKNGLASPNNVPGDPDTVWPCAPNTADGVTEKGRQFLAEMERLHMLVDVSHLSDAGFWDVVNCTKRPFVASHSNARALCGHVRNLTDAMIKTIGTRGGLIGLNYCAAFLDANPDRTQLKSRVADMARHAAYIIQQGGEDVLALGSDFDGIEGDLELQSAADMPKLAQGLAEAGFTPRLIEKIFYKNALEFYKNNL
ncbi:MAG: dipeptidase [Gemmiger sp.]|nr:dipeptidase [Gemmiger sp.]